MVGLRRTGLAILALLLPTASAATAPCVATASVVPEKAFVGQQVLYVLRIEQRRDVARVRFEPPLSFPSLRSEWLPTVRLPDPDEGTRAYEERRALHPGHAGELRLPEASLLCETPTGSHRVRVPALALHVRAVPDAGRPPEWNGTIGPLELHWQLTPDRVALGGTVRLGVRIEGPGTVWRIDPGVEQMLAPGDADIFPLEPETLRDKGRSLSLRHYQSYDVVPRRTGELVFPGLRVIGFDPETERFEEHVLPDLILRVAEAAEREDSEPEDAERVHGEKDAPIEIDLPASSEPTTSSPSDPGFPVAWVVLAFGLGIGALLLRRLATRSVDPRPAAQRLLREAETFLAGGKAAEGAATLARCLSSLTARVDDAGDPFAAEAANPRARALALLEQRLERARFAGDPDLRELDAIATALDAWLAPGGAADC